MGKEQSLENLATKRELLTKKEFEKKCNYLLERQELIIGILERMELRLKIERIEKDVEKNKGEIGKIKTKLAMV